MDELPAAWRAKLAASADTHVTVRIETAKQVAPPVDEFVTDDPAFGMWRDCEDVAGYVRSLRASRFNDDATRRKD